MYPRSCCKQQITLLLLLTFSSNRLAPTSSGFPFSALFLSSWIISPETFQTATRSWLLQLSCSFFWYVMVEDSIASKSHEKDVQLGLSKWGKEREAVEKWTEYALILSFSYGLTLESHFDSVVPFFNWNFSHWTRWKPFLNVWIPAFVKELLRFLYTM